MDTQQFESRKRDHLNYALALEHQASQSHGLDRVHLVHEALPELDFQDIDLTTTWLEKPLLTPFFIAGMTSGHPDAFAINHRLAAACEARGWILGLGSQRRELEIQEERLVQQSRLLRQAFPSLVLLTNLGLSQLIQVSQDQLERLMEISGADALAIHCNALQEALQPEGTPHFRGGWEALQRVCRQCSFPILIKETGCGFSRATLQRLQSLPLVAVDVSGLGGTHWGRIEGARAQAQSWQSQAALTFAHWGESTLDSILAAQGKQTGFELWASGGVRSGLDAAKLLALGAHRVGYAQPALVAALEGSQSLERWMDQQEKELKLALFCTGCQTVEQLRQKKEQVCTLQKR